MRTTLDPSGLLLLGLSLIALGIKAWALVDAGIRPSAAYVAAGKLTKPIWVAILAAALLLGWLGGAFSLLGLVGIIAALVYLLDVRPAVRGGRDPWG